MNNLKQKKNITTIGLKKLWGTTIIGYIIFFIFIFVQIQNIDFPDFFYGFGVGIMIGLDFLIISDIIENKVYNKWFWVISMFVTPPFAIIAYMIQRDKLIRLGKGFHVNDRQ